MRLNNLNIIEFDLDNLRESVRIPISSTAQTKHFIKIKIEWTFQPFFVFWQLTQSKEQTKFSNNLEYWFVSTGR